MSQDENETLIAPPPEVREPGADTTTIRRLQQQMKPWWIATVAVLFLALWIWREVGIRVAREHIVSQDAEINRLEVENTRLVQVRERLTADLEALAAADSSTIQLTGQKAAPQASGRVFLNTTTKRAIAFFYNIPPNATDKSYQLWIVGGEGSRLTSAGTFDVSQSGSGSVTVEKVPDGAKAFTVTLEPKGGSEQPAGEIYVSGNVG